jgi:putative ABC transport system permease protein
MNLTTARSSIRIKEVGIRKASGADRFELVKQFLGETIVLSLLALTLAVVLVYIMLPFFHQLTGKAFSLVSKTNIQTMLGLLGIVLLTGVAAGTYPAFYLSGFQPVSVFRASVQFGLKRNGLLRKVLVVGQFMFTVILIQVTIAIYGQLYFIQNTNLGFDNDNIIYFASYGEYGRNYEATKNALLQNPNVLSVCLAFPPSQGLRETTEISWEGKDPNTEIRMHSDMGDYDFIRTFGIRMTQGRFYSREYSTDVDNFVVNQTAMKVMGLKDPLGKRLTYRGKTGTIIGVVKDYHGGSLHHPILPKIIELSDDGFFICAKFRSGYTTEMIRFFEDKWEEFVPNRPFRYRFLDESIDAFYQNERRIGKIFRYFTALAISIACLGLFGLSSFTAERRTKEIGIRKVLGASVSGILLLLTKEFVKWVIIANLIAWPVAWFIMDKWLQNFAYRIPISWWMFVLSGALALVIALMTVSFQAIKAATANPVESLRYE